MIGNAINPVVGSGLCLGIRLRLTNLVLRHMRKLAWQRRRSYPMPWISHPYHVFYDPISTYRCIDQSWGLGLASQPDKRTVVFAGQEPISRSALSKASQWRHPG